MEAQRWTVGDVTITSVVEDEVLRIPPELFFPGASAADVATVEWLRPVYADAAGTIGLRVQAFIVTVGDRRVLVDPCVGNGKPRAVPFWDNMTWPFLERFVAAGFDTEKIDTVLHTHLHADHVGWDTHLVDGSWVPTFVNARHLYTERELEYCRAGTDPGVANVYDDSVAPVVAAGLADVIPPDADLGDGMRLEPTSGHTPGQVALWIESRGERALVTGDFVHHPVQFARPHWDEIADLDAAAARAVRRRLFERAAATGALVLGTHFPARPAGRVVSHGDAWRFVPEP